jgi:hypothetical protein
MVVQITQFMAPNGEIRERQCEVPDDCAVGYEALRRKNCRLTAEVLTSGHVSQCIEHEEGDYDIRLARNGQDVITSLITMIRAFDGAEFDKWLEAVEGGCEFDADGIAF